MIRCLLCVVLMLGSVAQAQDDALARRVTFDIAPQALSTALLEFSKQAQMQIIAPGSLVDGLPTQGVHGEMPMGDGLRQLLAGTPLQFRLAGPNTIAIESAHAPVSAAEKPLAVITVPEEPAPAPPKVDAAEGAVKLEEITVTATKRLKSIRDIAGSVSAIRGEDLEKIGAQGLQDYIKLVPGVTLPDVGDETSTPIIRGISTSIAPGTTQATAGVFMDDIPLSDPILPSVVPDLNPFDFDRVEVLKGPVGTLFGADALAGAIRYITRKPELGSWGAKLMGEGFQQWQGVGISPTYGAMFNVPIGESIALRAAGVYRKYNGAIDDIDSRRMERGADKLRQFTYRTGLRWQVLDALRLDLMYMQQDTHRFDESFTDQPYRYERADTPFPSPTRTDYRMANATLAYDFDWATLSSSTNYFRKIVVRESLDRARYQQGLDQQENETGQQLITNTADVYAHSINEELRLQSPDGAHGPWEWLAGAAYFHSNMRQLANEPAPATTVIGGIIPIDPTQPIDTVLGGEGSSKLVYADLQPRAYEVALFGELTRKLGSHFEVTGGARLFKAHVDSDNYFAGFLSLATGGQANQRNTSSVDAKGVNPKLSIRYLHNRNVQLYALVSKGFQFGGVQIIPLNPSVYNVISPGSTFGTYKSSTLWNYELGLRTEWLDRRLKFDTALFYLSWKDLQLDEVVASSLVPNYTLTTITANIGHAHSEGIEAALSIGPIGLSGFGSVTLTSNGALIKAETDVPFDTASGGTIEPGTRLPGTPRWQAANILAYEQSFTALAPWQAGFSVTHTYLGQSYNDLDYPYQAGDARAPIADPSYTNTLPTAQLGNYNLWDARVHLQMIGRRLAPDLSVSLKNFLGKTAVAGLFTANGYPSTDYFLTPPRTLLVQLAIPL